MNPHAVFLASDTAEYILSTASQAAASGFLTLSRSPDIHMRNSLMIPPGDSQGFLLSRVYPASALVLIRTLLSCA
jgi:hypothetical protein